MFYVSSINGMTVGVTDTLDNVEEFYTARDLMSLIKKYNLKISGVDWSGGVCTFREISEGVRVPCSLHILSNENSSISIKEEYSRVFQRK